MSAPKIAVVGAGPGGLTAAMILARRGCRVTVYEKRDRVGGRNEEIRLGPYRFDTGPTFLMMKFLLDEMFAEAGRDVRDYLEFTRLEPMYRLQFADRHLLPTTDPEGMRAEIRRAFPGEEKGLDRFLAREAKRYRRMYPCLQKDYSTLASMVHPDLIRALPRLSLGRSLYGVLGDYFRSEELKLCFTFQSKYLGMSPWSCPGLFAMIPYVEHAFGIYHVRGGLAQISEAMAKALGELGGEIRLKTPVSRLALRGRAVTGVELADGKTEAADAVVLNADFAHAMTHLVPPGVLRKYTPENLGRRDYSCSTFMLYLGVDRRYELSHHTIVFSRDYAAYLRSVTDELKLVDDISFYLRDASAADPGLAPEGHSALYILVPVPNNKSGIDWGKEQARFREVVLAAVAARTPLKDLRARIRVEKTLTPADWEKEHDVFQGATFNLSHKISQMLYFRPRNAFEELGNCYLVGGGTHPGSGLPTIYESGRISANLISRRFGLPFRPAGAR